MRERKNFSQDELRYVYERGKEHIEGNPERAAEYEKIINEHAFYQNIDVALKAAKELNETDSRKYQVWARVAKKDERYYVEDYYIVSNNWKVLMAAEFMGMEQILSI